MVKHDDCSCETRHIDTAREYAGAVRHVSSEYWEGSGETFILPATARLLDGYLIARACLSGAFAEPGLADVAFPLARRSNSRDITEKGDENPFGKSEGTLIVRTNPEEIYIQESWEEEGGLDSSTTLVIKRAKNGQIEIRMDG